MTVYIVDIEAVETRYTAQWKWFVPKLMRDNGLDVKVISGPHNVPAATSPGAFLNFGGTNIYKAAQVERMGHLFTDNIIKDGDYFLFTDAWHPGIINLKYMSELLGIKIKIGALWHAGSYDPADFLGRLIGDAPWVRHAEKSFFHAIDHNYFATDFHIEMFRNNLFGEDEFSYNSMIRTGWPMSYMKELLGGAEHKKDNLILFPHRIAPEKQVEIFRDLALQLPQYEFIVCQDTTLTKHQYHNLLKRAKIVFSASLQETLGIGCYEGALVGAIPMVPDRLSYSEMYTNAFKYPSEWTEDWEKYIVHREKVKKTISVYIEKYEDYVPHISKQADSLTKDFFSADVLVDNIKSLD